MAVPWIRSWCTKSKCFRRGKTSNRTWGVFELKSGARKQTFVTSPGGRQRSNQEVGEVESCPLVRALTGNIEKSRCRSSKHRSSVRHPKTMQKTIVPTEQHQLHESHSPVFLHSLAFGTTGSIHFQPPTCQIPISSARLLQRLESPHNFDCCEFD